MTSSRIYSVEGIILKRRSIGEADRLVTVFTKEYGKIKSIAKGVRKITSRRAPYLEVFSHVMLFLHQGKKLDVVTDIQVINAHTNMRAHLERISIGYYICELIDALLPERQEHRDVFLLLTSALDELDNTIDMKEKKFATDLLRALGFLSYDRMLTSSQVQPFIENIIERRVHSHRFLVRLRE